MEQKRKPETRQRIRLGNLGVVNEFLSSSAKVASLSKDGEARQELTGNLRPSGRAEQLSSRDKVLLRYFVENLATDRRGLRCQTREEDR